MERETWPQPQPHLYMQSSQDGLLPQTDFVSCISPMYVGPSAGATSQTVPEHPVQVVGLLQDGRNVASTCGPGVEDFHGACLSPMSGESGVMEPTDMVTSFPSACFAQSALANMATSFPSACFAQSTPGLRPVQSPVTLLPSTSPSHQTIAGVPAIAEQSAMEMNHVAVPVLVGQSALDMGTQNQVLQAHMMSAFAQVPVTVRSPVTLEQGLNAPHAPSLAGHLYLSPAGVGAQTHLSPGGVGAHPSFSSDNPSSQTPLSQSVPSAGGQFAAGVPGVVTQFSPGWIQQMHHQLQESQLSSQQQQQQHVSYSVGCRTSCHPSICAIRANAPEARFKALYPAGFHVSSHSVNMPNPAFGGNTSIRYPGIPVYCPPGSPMQGGTRRFSFLQPAADHSLGASSTGYAAMEVDQPATVLQRLPQQAMEVDSPMAAQALFHLLDARLQLAGTVRTLRDVLIQFVLSTYSGLGVDTYRIPHKSPVSQKHPDKALVRAREGESRVSMALECLSAVGQEAMVIVSDYHYENFLKNFGTKSLVADDVPHMAQLLSSFVAGKMFGDFDLLVFHPKCGVFVIGLCAVNSNSDVQYILKRLQKARQHLDKSRTVMERAVQFLGLDCPVTLIFSTPNLKRVFLHKVTSRDKSLHRTLGALSVLCLDELPLQFRSEWMSQDHFDLLTQWWRKVKVEQIVRSRLTAEQFNILVGSFLCPVVSSVDFDQNGAAKASSCKAPRFESERERDTATSKQPSGMVSMDLSSLTLSIGNVTKSFTQYMEEYVDFYFPNFMQQTYRVPPVHFNIQKLDPAGEEISYDVLSMPMSKDTRGDEGENRVVSAIEILGLKYDIVRPVFIICDFQYNNYLNKLKETMFIKGDDRRPQRAYGQSVRAQHDCLLVHRNYGIVIISVKAVGDNFDEWASSGSEQWTAVKRTLGKVLKQLPREEKMVQLVLSDMAAELQFRKLIALPNLYRQDVDTAISDDPDLQQKIEAMFPGKGTSAFLCKDELCGNEESIWEVLESRPDTFSKLCHWWDVTMGRGQPDVLSQAVTKQIIGRYCGLLSTVEVWTVQTPRVEVRSLAEAIQETAERFSHIVLTPEQVGILHLTSRLLFITGPPGGGKTLTLLMKAEKWAMDQEQVVILNLRQGSQGLPLGHLLHKQLQMAVSRECSEKARAAATTDSLSEGISSVCTPSGDTTTTSPPTPAAASGAPIQRMDCDSAQFRPSHPGCLLEIPHEACVVVDEITRTSHAVLTWLIAERRPKHVWCAGQFQDYCPPEFEMGSLDIILRCPPMIQRVLAHTSSKLGSTAHRTEKYTDKYRLSSAPHGLATDGPRPMLILHREHTFPSVLPQDCEQCAHKLVDLLTHRLALQPVATWEQTKRRKLGPPPTSGDSLAWRDVVMVCRHANTCTLTTTMKKRGVPLSIISDTADPQVAIPTRDELIFTTSFAMTGLERKVVIYVPFESADPLVAGTEHRADRQAGGQKGEGCGLQVGQLDDLQVGQAVQQLSEEDQVTLWYTASRCLAQLILFIP